MGVKKEKSRGSLPARPWFGSGYILLPKAALVSGDPSPTVTAKSSPCPLVLEGLIYMDCSRGFSRPLASSWAVTERHLQHTGQRAESEALAVHSPDNSGQWRRELWHLTLHCRLQHLPLPLPRSPTCSYQSPDTASHLTRSSGQLRQL